MSKTATITELLPRPVNTRVGANIRIVMQLRGKSQADLAELLHTTQSSMSRRIKGITDWSPDEMTKVAGYLRVDVGRFFEELPDLDSNQEPAGSSLPPVIRLSDRTPKARKEHPAGHAALVSHFQKNA